MNRQLKTIARTCGVEINRTVHLARHNFGTHITLSQGVPLITVSHIMGHTSTTTTQIYAKLLNSKIGEDMKALRSRIEGKHTAAVGMGRPRRGGRDNSNADWSITNGAQAYQQKARAT